VGERIEKRDERRERIEARGEERDERREKTE